MAADLMVDALGTPLLVGQTVKLVGVISALDPFNNRYNDVTITLSHPIAGVPDVLVSPGGNSVSGQQLNTTKTIQVAPSMLVVGA